MFCGIETEIKIIKNCFIGENDKKNEYEIKGEWNVLDEFKIM